MGIVSTSTFASALLAGKLRVSWGGRAAKRLPTVGDPRGGWLLQGWDDRRGSTRTTSHAAFLRAGERGERSEELGQGVLARWTETRWPTLARVGHV